MENILLSLKQVSKIYTTEATPVKALDSVSFDILKGEIFGLLGVNGAGKTTLSSILATLHPVSSGDIVYAGESIYKNIYRYRRKLGYCPQYQNLDMALTVRQNLEFAGRFFLLSKEKTEERVEFLIEKFELRRYEHFKIDDLSGGNKQRVLIARALIHEPALVLLDEPTVGLDPDIRKKLWDMIKQLREDGVTVVLTTHYLDEAEYLSDRICILHRGKVVKIESVASLMSAQADKSLEDVFLRLLHEHIESGAE
ncbi:ABC transporter ATP-binding protein [bacterium]|nr:MAG: ABC transporter ATP-binding protein [bacterium]QQR61668.1 MAG: ABC transporter ATP-binding protein [bacterium]QQR62769.1 MAG: ABC transporter ATP-binding protein [bacterium]